MQLKIYTKSGDSGSTISYSSLKIPKDSFIVDLNGAVDYLQSSLDLCTYYNKHFQDLIGYINIKLWQLGGEISLGGIGKEVKDPVTWDDVRKIENEIDKFRLPDKFIRFTKLSSIHLNEARVRCRNLERDLTPLLREKVIREEVYGFINRLSDLLFVMAYFSETN